MSGRKTYSGYIHLIRLLLLHDLFFLDTCNNEYIYSGKVCHLCGTLLLHHVYDASTRVTVL